MKKITIGMLLLIGAFSFLCAADEARFMSYPTVQGDRIVFSYEGDLWSLPVGGGQAVRLTTFPGEETFAHYSPDGRWIAFTANYDGPQAVYLMSAGGGIPKRLTYNPGGAEVVAWTPRQSADRLPFEIRAGD